MSPRVSPYRPWWRIIRYLKRGDIWQYLVSGMIVFGADYLVFFGVYQLLHLELAWATGAAYSVGWITNFILLRYWAFARQAQRDYLITGTFKYGVWLAINFVITYLLLKYLQQWGGLTPYIGKF